MKINAVAVIYFNLYHVFIKNNQLQVQIHLCIYVYFDKQNMNKKT